MASADSFPTPNPPRLLDIPNPFIADDGRLKLLEPADASLRAIFEQLLDGSYRKPFIRDDGRLRCLHFSLAYIQSAMCLDEPDRLDLRYTQKMAGFLLFKPRPTHVLILGLGGGSLAKFCYRHLPGARITVVEIDANVIALRRHFMVPEDDERFQVVHGDGAEHVGALHDSVDVLLVDAFDAEGLAAAVGTREFIRAAYRCLSDDGVLVMNLAGPQQRYRSVLDDVLTVFDRQTLLVSVCDDSNFILFGFKGHLFEPNWRQLRDRARELRALCGLDFPAFTRKLERSARIDARRLLFKTGF